MTMGVVKTINLKPSSLGQVEGVTAKGMASSFTVKEKVTNLSEWDN